MGFSPCGTNSAPIAIDCAHCSTRFKIKQGASAIQSVALHTEFLNVDLDIYSAGDLTPLVSALGPRVDVLYLGRHKRTWETHLELSKDPIKSPNSAIRDLCKLIASLPPAARQLWDTAKIRQFNIGIQGGADQPGYWSRIEADTVKSAAELNASIVLTIYPAHQEVREKPKSELLFVPQNDSPQDRSEPH